MAVADFNLFLNYYLARRAPYIRIRPHLIRISAFPYARDAYSAVAYFAAPYLPARGLPASCFLSPRLRDMEANILKT